MAGRTGKTPPRTPAERRLAALWEEVLELPPGSVAAEDDFFALGGDSLRASQLLARLEEERPGGRDAAGEADAGGGFGEIGLDELFDLPTLGELAARLTVAGGGAADEPGAAERLSAESAEGAPLPLSSPQRRLWFLDQLEPGNPAYNLAVAVRIAGDLEPAALAAALSAVVRRQAALRSVFRVVAGAPVQIVVPVPSAAAPAVGGRSALPRIDLDGLPRPAAAAAAAALAPALARVPFDLARGPLLAAGLVRLGRGEHELLLVVHHIVSDAWSLAILVREVAALYEAAVGGAPARLAALPIPYGDFVRWQEGRTGGDALAASLDAWRARLRGAPAALVLPSDRPRPVAARQSYRGAHAVHRLPAPLADAVRAYAGRQGASLFMVLLAAFQALAARLSGQRDLVVGTAVANRDRVELEGLVGLFVNTLPLRVTVDGEASFAELLTRVKGVVLAALGDREVPFERLVDEVQPRRDRGVPPLVQVMLVLQNAPLAVRQPAGLALRAREVDNGTARFDLALSLMAEEGGLAGVWKYSRDLWDAASIARLAGYFERHLAAVVDDPGLAAGALPLLGATERHQLVVEWNAPGALASTSGGGCLHQLFAAQVERTPEAEAVVYEGQSLTYRTLDRRAERLAHRLRPLGVGPEVKVGVALERSLDLMVGIFAVLKAGGAYLPLDPAYPAARLEYMLADARVPVLLTQERLLAGLPHGEARVLCLDAVGEARAPGEAGDGGAGGASSSAAPAAALPDNLAYVIYTSGSTGRPKGAMVAHRAIVNRLLWMQETYGLAVGETVLQKTPLSFDVSVWELFWPLIVGARLVLARPGGHQDSAYLAGLIAAERVTTLHFVPSMLQVFLEELRLDACAGLRRVVVSGEALPRELERRFFARLGAELHNLYGPTEAAVDVTAWACARRDDGRSTVPIGRPIAGLRIHLLDPARLGGAPVPIGVPGHLHIGGVGLGRGYMGRPELTAERWVPDGTGGGESGARLYATGDLARLAPDGAIEFLGRLDHQVKVRGLRIELGEIEAALAAHPTVREAVVTVHGGGAGGGGAVRLVGYVVGHAAGAAPVPEELREALAARLPQHMVPQDILVLPSFPLSPSGKVDRRALPAPAASRALPAGGVAEAPRTPLESRLAAIWREQLGLAALGIHDDFFALGGDSIQGALLVNRLQRELDAVVYVMALFDHPTVAGLAAHLAASYRQALLAAGWMAPDGAAAAAAADAEPERDEAAEKAALDSYVAARFSAADGDVPDAAGRNPRAVFILSPFRSGSTLLRVMLAGHPGLFAPPELELLGFATLGERRRIFAGRDSFAREGLLRAVMELRRCDATAATALMAEAEERDEEVRAFYGRLQEWAGGRLLVDKTPRYSLDPRTLRRAERWFDGALYIHLVRHPAGTMRSYLEARMDEVYRLPLPPRRQAELVWRRAHQNVLDFLAAVPGARQHRLVFEDLVRDPRQAMTALCGFLGLPLDEAMLAPYQGERMTDGLHGAGRMMGDPKFHRHRDIDAGVAESWRSDPEVARLDDATWRLAARLGYEAPGGAAAADAPVVAAVAAAAVPADLPPLVPVARPRGVIGGVGVVGAAGAGGGASVAGAVGAAGAGGGADVAGAMGVAPAAEEGLPLSHAQERLWFVEQLEQMAGQVYAMSGGVRLRGAWSRPVLAASLREIVRRHETLRTRFVARDGRPLQVIDAAGDFPLPLVDLGGLAGGGAAAEMARIWREGEGPRLDLARGPLVSAMLVRVAAGDQALLVALHHIVSDGWSVGVMLRELAAIYPALARGAAAPLPELGVQYADFAVWQRGWLRGELLEGHLAYWRRQLAGIPPLALPGDRPAAAERVFRARALAVAVPEPLVGALRGLARAEGVSLFVVLLAGFQALLARHCGQDDVAVGVPIANRNRPELEPLIGFFVNTLVLRTRFDGGPSFGALLGRARAAVLGAYEHQDVPFAMVVEALRPGRRQGASLPLAEALFTLQNQPSPEIALPGLDLALLPSAEGDIRTQFAVVLNLREVRGGGLAGLLALRTPLFDAATVARWQGHLLHLLAAAVADPRRPLAALPLLGESERQQVAVEWPDAGAVASFAAPAGGGGIVLTGELAAPIGIWGEVRPSLPDGGGEPGSRRARRRADGSLEAAQPAVATAADGAPRALPGMPGAPGMPGGVVSGRPGAAPASVALAAGAAPAGSGLTIAGAASVGMGQTPGGATPAGMGQAPAGAAPAGSGLAAAAGSATGVGLEAAAGSAGGGAPVGGASAGSERRAQARSALSRRREGLSDAKRELLAQRLGGAAVPAGTAPAGTLPAGALPAGTLPAGTLSAGTLPAATAPAAAGRDAAAGAARLPRAVAGAGDAAEAELDLAAEAVLDPAIAPPAGVARPSAPPTPAGSAGAGAGGGGAAGAGDEGAALGVGGIGATARAEGAVLLSGATGFIGAFLAAELLRQTSAEVICLVRGADVGAATARLRASLAEYGVWDAAAAARLRALPGDLALPRLGLSAASFEELGARLDAIYHNGAWVNIAYPYAKLKAPNVLGTAELLRLACRGRAKPFHFISSLSVFFAPAYRDQAVVAEDDGLEHVGGRANGYAQSKWVAEKLVAEAGRRGLPVAIYRCGRVSWHSESGVWNPQDALRHVMESCIEVGAAPDLPLSLDLTPVDFVARGLVALALRAAPGQAFHLLNEEEVPWLTVVDWMRSPARPLPLLPFADWLELAQTRASAEALPHLLALRRIVGALRPGLAAAAAGASAVPASPASAAPAAAGRFDTRNALAGLAGTGIVCPPPDAASLRAFLARTPRPAAAGEIETDA